MKKLFVLGCMILLLSGCSVVYIDRQSIDEIIDSILYSDVKLKSVSQEGYSYYLPQGVSLNRSDAGNSVFYYNHKKMYLYVDIISYYHNVDSNYQEDNTLYYSKSININGNKGYLVVTEVGNQYFIEFMYHYSKMEAYVDKIDLKKTLTVMAYILNSIDFNDPVLSSIIGENQLNYSEEVFNIFKPNGGESNFLDYVDKYDEKRKESQDGDMLDLDGNIE